MVFFAFLPLLTWTMIAHPGQNQCLPVASASSLNGLAACQIQGAGLLFR
jgi:hypothetical protein